MQHAYEELQRDGFIETVAGKGTFIALKNKDFLREEQLRLAELKLQEVVDIARTNDIALETLMNSLKLLYEDV